MIRLIICGIAGRMSGEVLSLALNADDINVIGGVESKEHPLLGKTVQGIPVTDTLTSIIAEADCIVDFTSPKATLQFLKENQEYKKSFVTGTTGFTDTQMSEIQACAQGFPVFFAPNMSVGVNHLYELVRQSSKALVQYDIEVVETHHNKKKDAPSGTAKAITRIIQEERQKTKLVHGREGKTGERPATEIGMHAVRGGDVIGEHRVIFFGQGEFVELRHYATSRMCFAAGTLQAIRFITGQSHGLYSMTDMFK